MNLLSDDYKQLGHQSTTIHHSFYGLPAQQSTWNVERTREKLAVMARLTACDLRAFLCTLTISSGLLSRKSLKKLVITEIAYPSWLPVDSSCKTDPPLLTTDYNQFSGPSLMLSFYYK